ncbi:MULTISPECIES: PAS domain S-box protein [unclassified Sphingobium]|uniref:PAS domain-containing sensor histidine kinase n=1 Tax=unclassified Sphingobium TaxID=2611147 RepID=UPI000D15DD64|nr:MULTISPECIES: PAS domain S-box protein [unclassified Sphingobium]PSO09976.1 histidine kinase [Sphingobium sp. AEW4]TWD19266.1 PAS domain S-box-containing protein [Sphingobium sp. AEW013]
MSNVEDFPRSARASSEFESLVAASPTALDAIPGAVYLCDHEGCLVRYNSEAAELWARTPPVGKNGIRICGSHRLFLTDGTPLAFEDCPMATALRTGEATRNAEVIMERQDGSRFVALVNIRALKDRNGAIEGAINCFQDISAYHATAEELQRRNEDLDDFFNNSAVGLHIVNGEGIIVRANEAELSLLGYGADEYIGRHIAEFHVDAPVIGDILHRLSSGEKLESYPARLRAKDDSIKHVVITSNGRFNEDRLVNTRCFTVDLTSLREAEAAKRESDERLSATYEAATIGIAEAGADGRLLRVNDAICEMLGRSRDQLLDMTFFDYTHPEDANEDAALYARQVAGELDSYILRKRAIKRDGTTIYLDIHSSSVNDASGFRYGVRVIQDVTTAKLLEDRLREGERHLRNLLEAMPAAVYTTDAEGHVTFFNRAAVEMAGRTPQQGDLWCVTWRLFNPDGTPLPHDQCPMAIALKENRPVRGAEAIAERPDGTRVPFIPYPTPLHDAEGNLIGAINMLVDITERKQAENRQKTLIDELNHRVKNTLATVQSLAAQTARHAKNADDLHRRLEARLMALSRAHDLLTQRHWEDAPLDSLVREVLLPLAGGASDRITFDGVPVNVSTRVALNLTMVLNELATNATKYGALSNDAGSVALCWNIRSQADAPRLILNWRESGGPPVSPPTRRGLGSRLMERCIERDLGGEFDLTFAAAGITCSISIPVPETV